MRNTLLVTCLALVASSCWGQVPAGETKGQAHVHTADSMRTVIERASLVLPAAATGGELYAGPFKDAPQAARSRVPVVIFLHGSSGLGLSAIGEWQRWLAGLGVASLAPDSFGLADRLTYGSPVSKEIYEKIHGLRLSEVGLALQALQAAPWADATRLVLAGTSEGAVAVARYSGNEFSGRIVFSWSCEDNYFVEAPRTALANDKPVLNIISASDPYFSPSNAWLGNSNALGHCGRALKDNKRASVVLIPGAPHTVINFPAARHAVAGFMADLPRR